MSRLLSLLLCSLYSFFAVASDGVFTVWHQKENGNDVIQRILAPVAERNGQQLKVIYLSTNELKSGLITSVINNTAPDVALIPSDFFGEAKTFKPASIPLNVQTRYSLPAQYWDLAKVNDQVIGVPLFVGNHMLMYYNKKAVPRPASSIKEIRRHNTGLPEGFSLIGWNYGELYWFIHFMTAFNAYPIVDGQISLNTAEMQKSLKYYRELSLTNFVSDQCDYTCAYEQFGDGKFAYSINGAWAFRGLKEMLGDDLGIAVLPTVEGSPMQSYFTSVALMYPGREKGSSLSQVDIEVLDALNDYEAQLMLFNELGLISANSEHRRRQISEAGQDYLPIINALENAIPLPSTAAMSSVWVGMRKGFDFYHGTDVDEGRAVQIMQTVADRELTRLQSK